MLTDVNYYLIVIDLSYVTVWLMWIKWNVLTQTNGQPRNEMPGRTNEPVLQEEGGTMVPLGMGLGRPQSRSRLCGGERSQPRREPNHGRITHSVVTALTAYSSPLDTSVGPTGSITLNWSLRNVSRLCELVVLTGYSVMRREGFVLKQLRIEETASRYGG
jgi:hypothetical protein